MKILQINSVVNTGSTGRIAENIGLSVMEQSWESFIAFGRGQPESKSSLINVGSKCDFYVHVLKTRLSDAHGLGSINASKDLVVKIKEIKPDIIHLHNIHGYYLNIEILFNFLSKANIPIVWTLHDCWSFTGHCAYFDFVNCNKWKTECFDCPNIQSYPESWFVDNSRKNFRIKKELFTSVDNITLVPVSKWLDNVLTNSFFKGYPSKVIHNGIDLSVFNIIDSKLSLCNKYKLNQDRPILLGVAGVWDKRKGLADFIKIQNKNLDYQIVLVGLNKTQIKSLPSSILGIERTESIEELAQLYNLADVFVNPTYEDNFPTTNLEALACGTPVITYNTGGSPEAIDENTGYVVEKGDIGGLIEKIELISKQGKRFYQSKCRERAERLYNKDDRYNDYIELYKEILNKR